MEEVIGSIPLGSTNPTFIDILFADIAPRQGLCAGALGLPWQRLHQYVDEEGQLVADEQRHAPSNALAEAEIVNGLAVGELGAYDWNDGRQHPDGAEPAEHRWSKMFGNSPFIPCANPAKFRWRP